MTCPLLLSGLCPQCITERISISHAPDAHLLMLESNLYDPLRRNRGKEEERMADREDKLLDLPQPGELRHDGAKRDVA